MGISKLIISTLYGTSISKELDILLSDIKHEDSQSIAAIAIKAIEYQDLLATAIPDRILQMRFLRNDRISDSEALVFLKLLVNSLNNLKMTDTKSISNLMVERKNEEAIVFSRVSFICQSAMRLLIWNIAPYANTNHIEISKLIFKLLSKSKTDDFELFADELIKSGAKHIKSRDALINSAYVMIKMPRWLPIVSVGWK